MYELREETKNINDFIQTNFGITCEKYNNLDDIEKRKLIKKYHKNHKLYKRKEVIIMIVSGEHTIFKRVKKGTKVWISGLGFVRAGITPEESRRRLDDRLDDALYSKPVAFVKKIVRRLKK